MAGIRYIGSKARVVSSIMAHLGEPPAEGRFVDLMAGTGVVSRAAADRGWRVLANDHLAAAAVMTRARLLRRSDVRFDALGGYEGAIEELNRLRGVDGFMTAHYAPGRNGSGRKYFTRSNAQRLDAIRDRIDSWVAARAICSAEHQLLLADLLDAVNRIANTAGTYGCYLSEWSENAMRPLLLRPRLLSEAMPECVVQRGDATAVETTPEDAVYLDPPYTKRQYAAYYHILETIVYNDAPAVAGVTGLRAWRHLASDFCFRRRAPAAFRTLLDRTLAARILVSYNEQGHLALDELRDILAPYGRLVAYEIGTVGRYRSNAGSVRTGSHVREYLFDLIRAPQLIR
jgi:adenine-specific DNA-methyltransferase